VRHCSLQLKLLGCRLILCRWTGDPLADAVIVWTRYTPTSADDTITLELRMAAVDPNLALEEHLNPASNPNLLRAAVEVTSDTDFIAKIDVTGLMSGTDYVYAFSGKYPVSNEPSMSIRH
jgi:alkaline phosphatase D